MRRLTVINAQSMVNLLQNEIHRNDESRYDHRLHGVLLVALGYSCSESAKMLGHTVTTIENWVNRFNKGGFNSLRDEIHTGRPPSLSEPQLNDIRKDIAQDPKNLGYDQNLWDGKLLSHHILLQYGITLSVRQCQRLFHKMEFRQRKPRPISSKVDKKKQECFKKTTSEDSKREI
nr:winged helix-turn-helix domain-containing protein [uncultured Methanospirillum sp.]